MNRIKLFAIAIAAYIGSVSPVSAGVITFEEPGLTPTSGYTTFDVSGFRFSQANVANFSNSPYVNRFLPTPANGLTLPRYVDGYTQVERIDGSLFDFLGTSFAAAASDPFGASLLINGYRDGSLLYHVQTPVSGLATDNTDTYSFYELSMIGVDRVDFATTTYWNGISVVDNFTYGGIAAVPEPETYAMLLAGLGLLGFVAQRRKLKESAAA